MGTPKILLPYNFTNFDKKALDFVCRTFSDKKEAEITLFNAYTPVPTIEMRGSPIMDQMRDTLSYLSQKVKEQEDALKTIKKHLLEKGFIEDNIDIVFESKKRDVAGDIIDLAQKGQFNVVVLNRKPGKIARFFAGSVSSKVVAALKNTTVCIVS
ncbi:MAG: universal stress protein [Desulfobacterales bacterium]|nr:universal stress protein [Desulfobacteraceae bacterium]MDH4012009.1 universal stress protein [Desulfobacterales bacterium]MDH3574703.1 universal stress protein [Desulfobacteraceae bacterium]MDH3722113.1 universal stress protein [Desulfobacteraceae bacterium]MDH3837330.1 universal stress protein [Desulfobacteraceae bacterium]